jgi:YgiT-type zinc finger domain-containing protein
MNLDGFPCEYCDGTVRERILDREPINHHRGIVVLENVPIGVCDGCGAHNYAAKVLKRAETILTSTSPPARTLEVPIEAY